MAFEYRIEGNIIWIKGKLDSSAAPELEVVLAKLTDSLVDKPPRAVLEFSGVKTLTSAPLRAMLTLAKRLRAAGGEVFVVVPSPNALEALKISGFLRLQLFKTLGSLAELDLAQPPASAGPSASASGLRQLQLQPKDAPPAPSLMKRILRMLCFWKR